LVQGLQGAARRAGTGVGRGLSCQPEVCNRTVNFRLAAASGEASAFPPIFYISGGRGKFLPFCLREGGVIQNYQAHQ
ncbi:hypothetical protein M674_13200, partial [Neisseria gonorrhoeae SK708]